MGIWNPDLDPGGQHEGYLVGLVPARNPDGTLSDYRFRELSGQAGDDPGPTDMPVYHVQMGCDCGWRSSRIEAPAGTVWVPFATHAPQGFEARCQRLWREHVELEATRRAETRGAFWRRTATEHGVALRWELARVVPWLVGKHARVARIERVDFSA